MEFAGELAASLPAEVLLLIFSRLPVDGRLCAAGVCRAWRAASRDASLYATVDLTPRTSGLARPACDGLLRCVSARAVGALTSLDVRGCEALTYRALLAVVRAHSSTLATLRAGQLLIGAAPGGNAAHFAAPIDAFRLEALLRGGAPALTRLDASALASTVAEASRLLEAVEAPLAPLRVHTLHFVVDAPVADDDACTRFFAALVRAAPLDALHTPVRTLLRGTVRAEAFVDAALAARLRSLTVDHDEHTRVAELLLPPLARLLRGGTLTALALHRSGDVMSEEAPAVFVDALRDSTSLRRLALHHTGVCKSPAAAAALLGALTGHASLASLTLSDSSGNFPASLTADVDAALAALLDAPSAALTHLDVPWSPAHSERRARARAASSAFAAAAARNSPRVRLVPLVGGRQAARFSGMEQPQRSVHADGGV